MNKKLLPIAKAYAVIWKRDKVILSLYGMKKTEVVTDEWQEITGDKQILESMMIFKTKKEALRYKQFNKDWEIVSCHIVANAS